MAQKSTQMSSRGGYFVGCYHSPALPAVFQASTHNEAIDIAVGFPSSATSWTLLDRDLSIAQTFQTVATEITQFGGHEKVVPALVMLNNNIIVNIATQE